jgi:hypothetical protein
MIKWLATPVLFLSLASPALSKGHFVNDPMFSEAMAKSKRVLDRDFSVGQISLDEWDKNHPDASDELNKQLEEACHQWVKSFKDALKRDKHLADKDDDEAVKVTFELLKFKPGPHTPMLKPTAMAERGLVMQVDGELHGKPAFSFIITFIINTMQEVDQVAYQAGYPAGRRAVFLSKGDGLDIRQGGDINESAGDADEEDRPAKKQESSREED